jgi:hypothetical protein
MIGILVTGTGSFGLCIATCFLSYQLARQSESEPPGYGWWDTSWDTHNISEFLGISIPSDVVNLQIQGSRGVRGSYGIIPRLQFTFNAPPYSTMAFINAFCDGVLYPGYNPLIATDSYLPSPHELLIRVKSSIHYSSSPGVPETTLGNRCFQSGWIQELVVEQANPNLYTVSYRLPYEPNSSSAEGYYPQAQFVTPFDRIFRLHVTGLREVETEENQPTYLLTYPTICLDTSFVVVIPDYWTYRGDDFLDRYHGSEIAILVDGIPQKPASMDEYGRLIEANINEETVSELWDYCLTDNWEVGTHNIQVIVNPPDGSEETFEWKFEVQADLRE